MSKLRKMRKMIKLISRKLNQVQLRLKKLKRLLKIRFLSLGDRQLLIKM